MGKCSRARHPRQYPGNSHFLYSLPPFLSPSFSSSLPNLPLALPGFIFWLRLPHLPSPPLLFRMWELEAPFPNHHVGREWLLAAFTLKFEDGEEKERGKKGAKLAMFTQRDFALIQACELDRAQNKRKQMCPSRQQIYYY